MTFFTEHPAVLSGSVLLKNLMGFTRSALINTINRHLDEGCGSQVVQRQLGI